ncbi:hypothetical protein caldi_06150 [Caldinitratiruptor microaerophilus]|uniref:Plastocyanin-like domain-containing protein n=2 Tax=Caldinitratiruptor microaerophilus TaxID=671077 RepID=A0AA35G777_9FIRM|nr:hypothetical protein caldi_06150 [Caldinitratiruptor microaerophilus]
MLRRYHVVAVSVPITYNRHGDHDPNGKMLVLAEHLDELRRQVAERPAEPVPLAQPLVLRACLGDRVRVAFENRLDQPASLHVNGLTYDVYASDGASVGANPDTTVVPGGVMVYEWHADRLGAYLFHDLADPRAGDAGSQVHGLWGVVLVEPPGSRWLDPETHRPLAAGTEAVVEHPLLPDRREFVACFHDEAPVVDRDGNTPVDPLTGQPDATHAINYRAEPMRNRMRAIMQGRCAGCVGEDVAHDSWPFGDPPIVFRAYRGDPVTLHLVMAAIKESHVFHLHVHQWLRDPDEPDSNVIDSIAATPQQVVRIDLLYGAGSFQRAIGDSIFHCHFYPHFHHGMWGILRTLDVQEDGTRRYPDGSPIPALLPLADRPAPPRPTPSRPGFPHFIPGRFGQKAPKPPLAIAGGRAPTPLEAAHMDARATPGAVFANPAPAGAPVRRYRLVAIQRPIVYNRAGWHDPQGRLFVLAEDEEAVRRGELEPEPLVIRANAGEVLEIELTNKLPATFGGTAFIPEVETTDCGLHVHLVKFDPLVADGSNVGWNYDSSAGTGETIRYVWYADSELRVVYFHDHLFATTHQRNGLFGAAVVEPAGSTFHRPADLAPADSGTRAAILHPLEPDYRELVLAVQDFAPLFDRDGNPLDPPPVPGLLDDNGVMAVNYRSEPLRERRDRGDNAYAFSSWVHGDPVTPRLEGYAGDPVRLRLFSGAHEEIHSFNLQRYRWLEEPRNPDSRRRQQQAFGVSEAFTLDFNLAGHGDRDFDVLWYFGAIDDLWLGCWGLVRVFGQAVPHLAALPDRPPPSPRTRPLPAPTGHPPAPAAPPEPGGPVRQIRLVAVRQRLKYNRFGDHDPEGLVLIPEEELPAVRAGRRAPRPLVLYASEGEWLEVRVRNEVPPLTPPVRPAVPVDAPWTPSERVGVFPQYLAFDPFTASGGAVGFNADATAGRGGEIVYRWRAETGVGAGLLFAGADPRTHRHHGLFGAVVVTPPGTVPVDPRTGRRVAFGERVVLHHPLLPSSRSLTLLLHDGAYLLDARGNPVPDPGGNPTGGPPLGGSTVDEEDRGQRGFNYRNEPLWRRLRRVPRVRHVFRSQVHGDPATPLPKVRAGDPVVIHLLHAADKPRTHSFLVHGHRWLAWGAATGGATIGVISVGDGMSLWLEGGAGGWLRRRGDYAYRSGVLRWHLEMGLWGLLRVYPARWGHRDPRIGWAGAGVAPVPPRAREPAKAVREPLGPRRPGRGR